MFEYQHGDFFIIVTFVHGKSAMGIYSHKDGKTPLSTNEIRSFLDLNSFAQHWERSGDLPFWSLGASDRRSWTAVAAYSPKSLHAIAPALTVLTMTYARKHGYAR